MAVARQQQYRIRRRTARLDAGSGICPDCHKRMEADHQLLEGVLYCLTCAQRRKGLLSAHLSKVVPLDSASKRPPLRTVVDATVVDGRYKMQTFVSNASDASTPVDGASEGALKGGESLTEAVVAKEYLGLDEREKPSSAPLLLRVRPAVPTWGPDELQERMFSVIRWWNGKSGLDIRAKDARAVASLDMPLPVLHAALEEVFAPLVAKGIAPRSPRIFWEDLQEIQARHHKGAKPTGHGSGVRSLDEILAGR